MGGQQPSQCENSRLGLFLLKVREKRAHRSKQAQTLERSASGAATRIRHKDRFETLTFESSTLIFFHFTYALGRTEVPLPAGDFPKRVPAIARPEQDERLRPRGFFLQDHRYPFQPLRLVKYQPNRFRAAVGMQQLRRNSVESRCHGMF